MLINTRLSAKLWMQAHRVLSYVKLWHLTLTIINGAETLI